MEDLTGRQFGPYRIVAPLGEGGMAAVYKAYQANMDRYVALKVLPRHFAHDPEFVARFEQEAKMLAKLTHPHILPVHDYGEVDGYTYIVMTFMESGTLINLLRGQLLDLDQIERIINQIGDALDYAHSQGVIHRDVKPSNVLVDERGNCMLVDFGIAKMVEGTAHLTRTGGIIGTPAYMSPEQGRGEPFDHRIDIYALGVILYEMTTGRVPYKAETPIAVLIKHINDPLPPPRALNPALPASIEQVILKAMAKKPEDRFATAAEMVAALATAVAKVDQPYNPAEDKTAELSTPKMATKPAEELVIPTPQKLKFPLYVWLAGAAGALLLIVIACGFLLLNLEENFQTRLGASASPTPTPVLEPAQLASLTPVAATQTPTPVEPSTATPVLQPATAVVKASATNAPAATDMLVATNTPPPSPTPQPTNPSRPSPTPTPKGFASIILAFGDEGIGPGLFTDARSIAVDNNNGHIYVGEYTGGRIQVFDENGKFINQWSVDTEMPLRGMDIDRQGRLYIVQSGLIYQYDGQTGELLGELTYNQSWGFDDVAVAADGGLVAAWYHASDDIVRFNAKGEPILTITGAISEQTGSSELETRVAIDGLGNIYALGTFNNAVFKFSPEGKFLDKFGSDGQGPGTLDSPHAIAVDGQGRIYVSELVGPIKIFDSGGQYLDAINIPTMGMRFDDQGNLYVASRTKVIKYEINGP